MNTAANRSADRPVAYTGSWPILSHRTLADVGPAVIIDGEWREVHGQRFRITPDRLREDPRVLQAQWDKEPHGVDRCAPPDHAAQFREINEALRGPEPDRPGSAMALAIAIGCAGAGALMIAGVITAIAIAVRLIGGQ
jgi:hypothetical protein